MTSLDTYLYNRKTEPKKRCRHCKELKPISTFYKDRTQKDGLNRQCSDCDKELRKQRAVRLRNRTNIKYPKSKKCNKCKKIKASNKFRKDKDRVDGLHSICNQCLKTTSAKFRDKFTEFKANIGCKLCGLKEGECLLFHHKNPEEKEFSIHVKTTRPNFSNRKFQKELKKCICLCANCHAKLHYWYKRLFEIPEKTYLLIPRLV